MIKNSNPLRKFLAVVGPFLWLLCIPVASIAAATTPEPPLPQMVQDIANVLGDRYSFDYGDWRLYSVKRCITEKTQCFGNNPLTPYPYPVLSVPPGQVSDQPDHWKMNSTDGVVIIGYTPPKTRYFAFTAYLHTRYAGAGVDRTLLAASLGNSINLRNIKVKSTGSQDEFGRLFAIVAGADDNTNQDIKGAISSLQYFPAKAINILPMATKSGLRFGEVDTADDFSMLMRVGLPDVQADLDAYLAEMPLTVMRLKLKQARPPKLLPASPEKRPGEGNTELNIDPTLKTRLDLLADLVRQRYGNGLVMTELTPVGGNRTGSMCVQTNTFCVLNNQDTIYTTDTTTPIFVADDPRSFVIIVGVNHSILPDSKVIYTNHSVYKNAYERAGVIDVSDVSFPGGAEYHSGHSDMDWRYLYAYKFSLQCLGEPFCLELPSIISDPIVGIDPSRPVTFATRFYLDPHTNIYPAASELLYHRVFKFSPP